MHLLVSKRTALRLALSIGTTFTRAPGAVEGRVALLHYQPTLGEIEQNIDELTLLADEAFSNNANIVVTPELATTGYCVTRQQVVDELGLTNPYPELAPIEDMAIAHQGYVFVGVAEVTSEGGVFNAVVVYGPDGYVRTQHKRSLPLWHDRGTTPVVPVTTPYGDIAVLVCSDSYLPDMSRIATLNGADVIVVPANWWGRYDQEQTWQVRARENGVWFLVANRWGQEIDERYSPPYTYDMNDAPSVAIDPDGRMLQIHRAEDDAQPHTTILYQDIAVPAWRIGNDLSLTYSVSRREPGAYGEIANAYYRRDLGYLEYPGLPATGATQVAALAYRPNPVDNLPTIKHIWRSSKATAEVLVLPGLGVSMAPIDPEQPGWAAAPPWKGLQAFVDGHGISLLVTSVFEQTESAGFPESLLLLRAGQPPTLRRQSHTTLTGEGSGAAPAIVDLEHARVGILLGRDAQFPEVSTHLAKSGVDLLVITSTVGVDLPIAPLVGNYFSDVPTLQRTWRVRSNECVHVAASDWTGVGILVENGGGYISRVLDANSDTQAAVMGLDSASTRMKYLNAYESHDLATLLGE